MELIVTKGLPGSGKTTWARKWVEEDPANRVRVNRDDIRRMLGPYWIPSRESLVTEIEKLMVFSGLDNKFSVVVDATNFRNHWQYFLYQNNFKKVDFSIKDFTDISVDECIARDKLRDNPVGIDVIIRMANKYLNK